MSKVGVAMLVIYSLSGLGLQYLAWHCDLKLYVVAVTITLVSISWIASQLDG